jgi:hypothetical protein
LVNRVVTVSPGDSVLAATKKMVEGNSSSVVVAVGSKALGILTCVMFLAAFNLLHFLSVELVFLRS